MKYATVFFIVAITLSLSCLTTQPCNTVTADGNLFARIYRNLQSWPGLESQEYKELKEDMESTGLPENAALYETKDKKGYLYISHIGWHVAVVYIDRGYEIHDAKVFPSKLGYSATWRDGLILTLHRHPGTGMFVDSKVLVETTRDRINLVYDVK